jgi:ferric-dicitrate binding protein FerR (iron transport regulator)
VSRSDEDRVEGARLLMMAALDGELSPGERTKLDRLLAADTDLREEWDRLSGVKEVTETMTLRRPPEETWDIYFESVYNRLERGMAWVFLSVGTLIVVGYGLWHLLASVLEDAGIPGYLKFGIFAVLFGGAILLVSVLRERLFLRKTDPYREIER